MPKTDHRRKKSRRRAILAIVAVVVVVLGVAVWWGSQQRYPLGVDSREALEQRIQEQFPLDASFDAVAAEARRLELQASGEPDENGEWRTMLRSPPTPLAIVHVDYFVIFEFDGDQRLKGVRIEEVLTGP